MAEYEKGTHTVYTIQLHFVWITKYRYKVLKERVAERARELIRQVCQRNHVEIIKGHMEMDHVHIFVKMPPTLSPSKLMQYIKGSSSRHLQEEFPDLNKRYWGRHMWGIGYFCASAGIITDEMVKQYIENHREETPPNNFSISGEPGTSE